MKKSPIQYIMQNPVSTALTVIFILAFALTTIFLLSSQSGDKKEIRKLNKENKMLKSENKTLTENVSERDKNIFELTAVMDTLKKSLTVINSKIVTINESSSSVASLDLQQHIELLAAFVSTRDSVAR